MWSVFSKQVDVHLAPGLAMIKRSQEATTVLEFPSTWSLQKMLEQVHLVGSKGSKVKAVDSGGGRGKWLNYLSKTAKTDIRLSLSSLWCQTIAFTIPDGLTHWSELQSLGQAAAQQSLGTRNVVSSMDPHYPGLVASINSEAMTALANWSQDQKAEIVSLHPLWSVATRCALVQKSQIRGVALIEPSCMTLIASVNADGPSDIPRDTEVLAMPIDFDVSNKDDDLNINAIQSLMNRWKIGNGLRDDEVITLKFGTQELGVSGGTPSTWRGHWSIL